jgi:Flp pilus assembly protein TadB
MAFTPCAHGVVTSFGSISALLQLTGANCVGVKVFVGVFVGVNVGVAVAVFVGVSVGVAVAVAVFVGVFVATCAREFDDGTNAAPATKTSRMIPEMAEAMMRFIFFSARRRLTR